MKNILYFAGAVAALLIVYKLGLAFGGVVVLIFAVGLILAKYRFDQAAILRKYATRYENIYIVSRHPDTEEEHELRPDVAKLVVWSDFHDVILSIRKEEALLRRAGNTFFTDPGLKEGQRLRVIPIIFRDGEFVNESWKDFRGRIRETIEADRVVVHSSLKKENPDWYMQFANGQNGIEWKRN